MLREPGWDGHPPPPVFKAGKSKQPMVNQPDPFYPNLSPFRNKTQLPNLPSVPLLGLHPSQLPLCPTSRSQIHLMTSPPSALRPKAPLSTKLPLT